jgi:hypothetical protein
MIVGQTAGVGLHLLDADTEKLAQIFQVIETGNITNASFRIPTVYNATNLNITLQTVDSTGNATGTLYGGSSPAYLNLTAAGYYDVAFPTPAAYNTSDVIAMVIQHNASLNGNVTIGGYSSAVGNFPYTEHYVGTAWVRVGNSTMFAVKVNDTFWANTQTSTGVGLSDLSVDNDTATTIGDENGIILNFTTPVKIVGAYWIGYPSGVNANYTVTLYNETDVALASILKMVGWLEQRQQVLQLEIILILQSI